MIPEIQSALIAAAVSVVIAIIGWIIAYLREKKKDNDEQTQYENRMIQLDKKLKTLEGIQSQLNELKAQTTALEKANELTAAANPAEKAPWGDAKWTGSGDLFRIRHEGNRNVVVTSVGVKQEKLQGMLNLVHPEESSLPKVLEPGDSIEYLPFFSMAGSPSTLIEWHWEGSDDARTTVRTNAR